jgi:3-hydroxyacyl-CoA dehydrogenase
VQPREISDEEITQRTLYTMVNEGAKILEEGMAQRASDIDVVWDLRLRLAGLSRRPDALGRHRGPHKIVEGLKAAAPHMGDDFSFSQLLLDKAANGEKFTGR